MALWPERSGLGPCSLELGNHDSILAHPVRYIVDQHQLGVLNHFSGAGSDHVDWRRSPQSATRWPADGQDGKWQADLCDPDGTRIELMEFQPVIKPCCSDFTADCASRKPRNVSADGNYTSLIILSSDIGSALLTIAL